MRCVFARISLLPLLVFAACGDGLDPDRAIAGGGVIEPGWKVRFDAAASSLASVRLVKIESGLLAENGPNAVFWNPENTTSGRYSLAVEVQHRKSHGHPHGAGLIFGGAKLVGADQAYTYFLVRDDGQFIIKTRDGDKTESITPWKQHDAVRSQDDKGVAKNEIAVEVGDKETRFLVNGVEVHRVENSRLHTDGLYGFRIVHNLEIHFLRLRCRASK